MNPPDPLAQLHPLRDPDLIGWWPLAPGWWVLIGLALVVACALGIFLYRRYRANAYRRQAQGQLSTLHSLWRDSADSRSYLAFLNALLKSAALKAFPRVEIASLTGEAWVQFLNATLPENASCARFDDEFGRAAYQAQPPELDFESLNQTASCWIRLHRVAR